LGGGEDIKKREIRCKRDKENLIIWEKGKKERKAN